MSARRSKDPAVRRKANREYKRRWRIKYPEKWRAQKKHERQRYRKAHKSGYSKKKRQQRLLHTINVSEQEYAEMFVAQGGVCAICPRGPEPNRRLAVDHCHETGRVRGLLCTRCNLGLGYFGDNEDLLMNAIGYLQ